MVKLTSLKILLPAQFKCHNLHQLIIDQVSFHAARNNQCQHISISLRHLWRQIQGRKSLNLGMNPHIYFQETSYIKTSKSVSRSIW